MSKIRKMLLKSLLLEPEVESIDMLKAIRRNNDEYEYYKDIKVNIPISRKVDIINYTSNHINGITVNNKTFTINTHEFTDDNICIDLSKAHYSFNEKIILNINPSNKGSIFIIKYYNNIDININKHMRIINELPVFTSALQTVMLFVKNDYVIFEEEFLDIFNAD